MTAHQKLADSDRGYPVIDTLVERPNAPRPRFSLTDAMFVERGDMSDWNLLHHLHYKAESLPFGPRFWKLTLDGDTIGCLVTGSPKPLLKERHAVLPQMKPGGKETKMTNTYRYVFINQNIRVVSRCVVDPIFRGIGAGTRFIGLVSRLEGMKFMEIQSSMSKFNYFAQKAGYRFVKPMNSNNYEVGLKFFRSHFQALPQDFEAIVAEIDALPPNQREVMIEKCREFYYSHSALEKTGNNRSKGAGRVAAMDAHEIIKAIQQIVLASPMYGIYKNPDFGRALPARLPISAFDPAGVNLPLVL